MVTHDCNQAKLSILPEPCPPCSCRKRDPVITPLLLLISSVSRYCYQATATNRARCPSAAISRHSIYVGVSRGPESAGITISRREKAHRNVFMLARWYTLHHHGVPCVHVHVLHSVHVIRTHWICCLVHADYEPPPRTY